MNRIAELNDAFRTTGQGGRLYMTAGVAALGAALVAKICAGVRAFSEFNPDNDPHGEHDFGSVEVDGHGVFWKIDYYESTLSYGSEDPADPTVTTRVLTIMLREEY